MFSHFRTVVPLLALLCLGLTCCSFPVRTGYDRNIGDYKSVPPSETASTPPKKIRKNPLKKQSKKPRRILPST